jgi:hypothetical protein
MTKTATVKRDWYEETFWATVNKLESELNQATTMKEAIEVVKGIKIEICGDYDKNNDLQPNFINPTFRRPTITFNDLQEQEYVMCNYRYDYQFDYINSLTLKDVKYMNEFDIKEKLRLQRFRVDCEYHWSKEDLQKTVMASLFVNTINKQIGWQRLELTVDVNKLWQDEDYRRFIPQVIDKANIYPDIDWLDYFRKTIYHTIKNMIIMNDGWNMAMNDYVEDGIDIVEGMVNC